MFKITPLEISGLYVVESSIHPDERGLFFEFYKFNPFSEHGFPNFVQDNISISKKDVIRGLHFQSKPHSQGKLVGVLKGSIFDVVVDIRKNSSTFGKYFSISLDDIERKMLYISPGFAHGFCALSDDTVVLYKNTSEYSKENENGIIWNDSSLGIKWPCENPIISEKDLGYKAIDDIRDSL